VLAKYTEYVPKPASAGLTIKKEALTDYLNGVQGGEGLAIAAHWSRQMGAYAGYWPQQCVADAIKGNGKTYDDKAFFAVDHPINPFRPTLGTFANLLNASTLGSNPAIDTGTVEDAFAVIQKIRAHVASIVMPNGKSPRFLKVAGLLHPPALTERIQQITKAKTIAQAAGASGGGSGDVEAIITNRAFGESIEAPELGAAFGGSDRDFYVITESVATSELGALVYIEREPFSIIPHTEVTSAALARAQELQWTTHGRNIVGYGHPYMLFKVSPT
jgi:hypothetical protein